LHIVKGEEALVVLSRDFVGRIQFVVVVREKSGVDDGFGMRCDAGLLTSSVTSLRLRFVGQ
jgi:hypothetical protein